MLPTKALSLISSFLAPQQSKENVTSAQSSSSLHLEHGITAIVFSKDRPGQLFACISSMLENVSGVIEIRIIVKASNDISSRKYGEVAARLYHERKRLRWYKEEGLRRFPSILRETIESARTNFILFQVDDAVHFSKWLGNEAMLLLQNRPDVLNIHGKLWKGATRCHPANNATMKQPQTFITIDNHLVFRRDEGNFDWNYPFDLSGGLYRRETCIELVQWLKDLATNPNKLELLGNELLTANFGLTSPFSACIESDSPIMSIITINRVQEEYANPIYQSPWSSDPWGLLSDEILARGLDLQAYDEQARSYTSVHVGDLFLRRKHPTLRASVLIPCRNAEKSIRTAIESVLSDAFQISAEIVVVDDASEDGTAWIAEDIQHRFPEVVRVFTRAKSSGLIDCLDFGLKQCHGDLIFRMDADDISLPGRLLAQLEAMSNQPRLGVLGTQAWVMREKGVARSKAPAPVGSASVAWSLFFYCPLVHPSVCIRRHALVRSQGYRLSAEKRTAGVVMEDYALWHWILDSGEWFMDNVPMVGLEHYKHQTSVTANWVPGARDLKQAEIALQYAQKRAPALKAIQAETWVCVCRPATKVTLSSEEVENVLTGLNQLKESIVNEFQTMTSLGDIAFVERENEARRAEMLALKRN